MAPKLQSKGSNPSKSKTTNPKKQTEEAQEDGLSAIILTDNFHSSSSFQPLTSPTNPSCLLPFLNSTLLDWTLESLSLANVESVFILSKNGYKEIKNHIGKEKVNHYGFKSIEVIPIPESRSLGDSMRELDSKQIIRTDFILCHADCVGNIDLESVVKIHKDRRLREKDAIMTVCSMPLPKGSLNRSSPNESLHFISPTTSQLLHYETSSISSPYNFKRNKDNECSKAKLPMELFLAEEKDGGVSEIEIRNDLVESVFYICSVDVPPLFSENFDYQTLSTDFIPGILTSDLLDSKIFLHISPSSDASGGLHSGWGYSSRVKDTKSYDLISKDVLSRWTFPLTPGANCPGGIEYSVRNGTRYVGKGVRLSRTSTFGPLTLLGPESQLSDNSKISKSVLGSNVFIGTNSKVSNSYLWSNVKVGNNCSIEKSIIGRNVNILNGVVIEKGCLIADDCTIGPNVTLEKFSRVGKVSEKEARKVLDGDDDDDDEDESDEEESEDEGVKKAKDESSRSKLGSDSIGYLWSASDLSTSTEEDSDEEEDEESDTTNQIITRLGYSMADHLKLTSTSKSEENLSSNESLSSIDFDSDLDSETSDDEDEDGGKEVLSAATLAGDLLSSYSNSSKLLEFKSEALASLNRALEENHTIDNAAIELKTLRMASNVPLKEVRRIVIEFFLEKFSIEDPKSIGEILDRWGGLIEIVSSDDQVEALGLVQSYCAIHDKTHSKLFVPLLKKFYNDDIVSDDSILAWWKSPISRDTSKNNGGEKVLEMRKSAEGVVRHVLESQEESEDEEDSE